MAVVRKVTCLLCGWVVQLQRLGLTEDGRYPAPDAIAHAAGIRVDTIGGRGKLHVAYEPLPLPIALGMRDALKAALARLEADIAAAENG